MGILWTILIGFVAGVIAKFIMPGPNEPTGFILTAILGIVEEGQEIIKEYKGTPALDAGLLSAAQAVEHYEIARYGTLKTWATQLGLKDAAKLLDETLQEEKKTDVLLSKIAEKINVNETKAPA